MPFPNSKQAKQAINNSVLKELDCKMRDLDRCFNHYGSYDLKGFKDNFDYDFFIKNKGMSEFACNEVDQYQRPLIGRALLSNTTIGSGSAKGKSQYKGSIFDSGHLLGHLLIGGIKDFDSRKTNKDNIVPQTSWANQGNFSLYTQRGNSQQAYEHFVLGNIKKAWKNKITLKVYYQVEAVYGSEIERVPRGVIIQAVSNLPDYLDKGIHVFIPNVQEHGGKVSYLKWDDSINMR